MIRDHDAACRVDHEAVRDGDAKAGAEGSACASETAIGARYAGVSFEARDDIADRDVIACKSPKTGAEGRRSASHWLNRGEGAESRGAEGACSVLGASFESGVRTVKKAPGDGNLRARVLSNRRADMGELRRLMFDGAVGVKPPRVLFPLVLVKHRSFEGNARSGRWLVELAIGEDEFCIFGWLDG